MSNKKETWLVLAGSGMKLYCFLGAIKAAVEAGYTFTGATCTSGGAVVGGALGKHWDPSDPEGSVDRLIAEAKLIDPGAVLLKSVRLRFWEWLLTKLWRKGPKGIFDSKKLLKEFRKHAPATIGDCSLPVHITAYQSNLKSPRPVLFTRPETDLPRAMLASMTLPVFDPTPYGKALLEDGGWVKNLPVPEDQPDVLAFYFEEVYDDNDSLDIVEDPDQLIRLDDNIERIMKIIDGLLQTNVRDSINEAEEEGVNLTKVILKTKMTSFDFFAPQEKRERAIEEGYTSAMKVLS